MGRPYKPRRIGQAPGAVLFKPAGVRARDLDEVCLTLDEFEALRVSDLQRLSHEAAAAQMGVSRQTFGNILASAHQKLAEVLVAGKALRIEGGPVRFPAGAPPA